MLCKLPRELVGIVIFKLISPHNLLLSLSKSIKFVVQDVWSLNRVKYII